MTRIDLPPLVIVPIDVTDMSTIVQSNYNTIVTQCVLRGLGVREESSD